MTRSYGEAFAARAKARLDQDSALAELSAAQTAYHAAQDRFNKAHEEYNRATQNYRACEAEESLVGKMIDQRDEDHDIHSFTGGYKSARLKEMYRVNPRLRAKEAAEQLEGATDRAAVRRIYALTDYLIRTEQVERTDAGILLK